MHAHKHTRCSHYKMSRKETGGVFERQDRQFFLAHAAHDEAGKASIYVGVEQIVRAVKDSRMFWVFFWCFFDVSLLSAFFFCLRHARYSHAQHVAAQPNHHNGWYAKWKLSWNMYTLHRWGFFFFCTFGTPICTHSRCLPTKISASEAQSEVC